MVEVGRVSDSIPLKSVGLAAYEVALVQQQAFEETLRELAARKAEDKAEAERKAASERARDRSAKEGKKASDHLVDVVVDGVAGPDGSGSSAEAPGENRGGSVDVAV
jgi:hypothetical protein